MNRIILAAGKAHRGRQPVLLTGINGKSLLQRHLLSYEHNALIQVIIGYEAEQFQNLANEAILTENKEWEDSGSAYSLLCANLNFENIIVHYADILYRPSLLGVLQDSNADITLVYDSIWKQRFIDRSIPDQERAEKVVIGHNGLLLRAGRDIPLEWATGEFIGLVRFQYKALEYLQYLKKNITIPIKKLSVSDLLELLRLKGFEITCIDVKGDWAELNDAQDIARFIMGTKAETLFRLKDMVQTSIILPQVAFTVHEWKHRKDQILEEICTTFDSSTLVIRSSAISEDSFIHSNAGAYKSVLNVPCSRNEIVKTIEEVIASYTESHQEDQVLVQEMLQNVLLSGVIFTCTLDHHAPFYVINYDDTGDTSSITSGKSQRHQTRYFLKNVPTLDIADIQFSKLLDAVREIEGILNYEALDIEFAISQDNQIYILQVRPLVMTSETKINNSRILEMQESASKRWEEFQTAGPHIVGQSAPFGLMPDWNPAEIIGSNPGTLAVDLYKYLIMDEVWARQRSEYGYRDVRPQPLLRVFAGKPYVDIRASFNSFIPSQIEDDLTKKLVDFYLQWLIDHPHLHDKIEFEVVPTCYGPKFSRWESRLLQYANCSQEEIDELKQGLMKITQAALQRPKDDLEVLGILKTRYKAIMDQENLSSAEKVRILLDDCKTYGTLPFAHLARSAFIAMTLLKEGVEEGWISNTAKEELLQSLQTVTAKLSYDAQLVVKDQKPWEEFVNAYGHLRPGTYDINSPAYRDDTEKFLRPLLQANVKMISSHAERKAWEEEKVKYFDELRSIGLNASDQVFNDFIRDSIAGREESKFWFTRNVSTVLDIIKEEGRKLELSPRQLSNLTLSDIFIMLEIKNTFDPNITFLKSKAKANEEYRLYSSACQLPALITKSQDFFGFSIDEEVPNFIGSIKFIGKLIQLRTWEDYSTEVENCAVLIPQADPGFDWLFGKKIAGLITQYGGVNSHMAIRSAEFGIPAAIGVGKQLFDMLLTATMIELDPLGQIIRVIQ